MSEEHVLVIPEARLSALGEFNGFRPFCEVAFRSLLDPEFMEFRPRSSVEEDPRFKQLIPYVLLQSEIDGQTQLFHYTRGRGQGEKRLHALKSVGIGGHISQADTSGDDWYRSGMLRELHEETIIDSDFEEDWAGFIFDDSSAVGRVHLGVVHRLRLARPTVRARESELADSGFAPIAQLKQQQHQFET